MTATLDLYVNGDVPPGAAMNSIQSWQYEGNNNYNGSDQNPADGDPRDFWDEFHAFVSAASPIPPGATFSLLKDSSNTASFYWINSIDLWDAPGTAAAACELDLDHQLRGGGGQHADQRRRRAGGD